VGGKFTGEILVMPKMDGVACSLRYDRSGALVLAATRGSGSEGEDITVNVSTIKDDPEQAGDRRPRARDPRRAVYEAQRVRAL
jgi:NAD-dependent DNA ligase